MKIIVTIPAYNEEETIAEVISGIHDVMTKSHYNYKILVLDDGSKDKTAEVARKNKAIVFSHQYNRGLAETFKTEIKESISLGADLIIHIDADSQYLPTDIPKLIEKYKEGYDLVLGSRFLGTIEEMPFVKKLGNRMFSAVISKILNFRVTDAQTGFRAFSKKVATELDIRSTHTYTQEQIIKAVKNRFRIAEVPIYFAKRKSGESRLIKNPFEYAAKAGINILRLFRDYEPLKFFGIIGGLIFSIGFIIGAWLLYLFLTLGKVGHTPSLILSILLLIVGIQIILFGLFADMRR